ncbi:MAG: methyltransferase family protein [Candidatus Helarchaeota archaeon]
MYEVTSQIDETKKQGLTKNGYRYIAREYLMGIIHFILLLVFSLNVLWVNAWVYFIMGISYQTVNLVVLYKLSPQLLNERGKVFHEKTKTYDKVFAFLFLMLIIILPIVVGIDAQVRLPFMPFNFLMLQFLSFELCIWLMIIGIIIFLSAVWFGTWAMVENTNFTALVRVQDDKEKQICTTGPYKMVRHPGYLAEIISSIGYVLILGTWWAFIPIAGIIALFIVRTALEDRTLREELPGYKEYAKKTRYRLIPFIW